MCTPTHSLRHLDVAHWNHSSSMLWMWTTVFKLLRDLYELQRLARTHHNNNHCNVYMLVLRDNRDLCVDIMKNLMDLVCSMQSVGKLDVGPGVVGLCGVVASLLGILELVYPSLKLWELYTFFWGHNWVVLGGGSWNLLTLGYRLISSN